MLARYKLSYDGKIRRLTGVRHIPDLSKNLISLGALAIMKVNRVETLYLL
jgi:hypothetical protein